MSPRTTLSEPHRGGAAVTAAGVGLGVVALTLYATGLSRAVGVVVAAVGSVLVVLGITVRSRRRWPHRYLLYSLAVSVVLLALYGVGLWIHALNHPPRILLPPGSPAP